MDNQSKTKHGPSLKGCDLDSQKYSKYFDLADKSMNFKKIIQNSCKWLLLQFSGQSGSKC